MNKIILALDTMQLDEAINIANKSKIKCLLLSWGLNFLIQIQNLE